MSTTLADNIRALRANLGMTQAEFASEVGAAQSYVSKWEAKGIVPDTAPLERIAALAGTSISDFRAKPWHSGPGTRPAREIKLREVDEADDFDQVEIQNIDLAFGLGSTFTDNPVDVALLKFPRGWVETITKSPPELLTWTRGRGDSMLPTIDDGDLILLDRSQRKVAEQDALWAFTVGDTGSIKRLRVKGDRYQILSDNPSVPPDEEPIDFVNIVARVVFIGRRT